LKNQIEVCSEFRSDAFPSPESSVRRKTSSRSLRAEGSCCLSVKCGWEALWRTLWNLNLPGVRQTTLFALERSIS